MQTSSVLFKQNRTETPPAINSKRTSGAQNNHWTVTFHTQCTSIIRVDPPFIIFARSSMIHPPDDLQAAL